MRLLAILLAFLAASSFPATTRGVENHQFEVGPAPLRANSNPIEARSAQNPLRADTLSFGHVDADGFAVPGETWTWDHGGADPLEGWVGEEYWDEGGTFAKRIDAATWAAGGNLIDPPILSGQGSVWIGAFQEDADVFCYENGLGYGNSWCQALESPEYEYTGSGSIALEFLYFNDTELDFDYTRVLLRLLPSEEEVELLELTDHVGLSPNHPEEAPVGESEILLITESMLEGETRFQVLFRMTSDGGWSDEDGIYETEYGPFGVDDVALTGSLVGGDVSYDFEADLEGWVPTQCGLFGNDFGVNHVSEYNVETWCNCDLSANVLEFHNDEFEHEYGSRTLALSNPVDVLNDVGPNLPGLGDLEIAAEWTQYSVMPFANGVWYRVGWQYYPWDCPNSNHVGWSETVGQSSFSSTGESPVCGRYRDIGTEEGLPQNAEQVRFVYEVYASCDLPIWPDCSYITNFTPILDNAEILFHRVVPAPGIGFVDGGEYQDGFSQSSIMDPNVPGRADVVRQTGWLGDDRLVLGDSLVVLGPEPESAGSWEARLWFRVRREGPTASDHPAYTSWLDLYGGSGIVGPDANFAWGFMDSIEAGTHVANNRFASYLREDDPKFDAGAGEFSDENEIIRDLLYPGTSIDYFVSSAYAGTPDIHFLLPDTTGGNFLEFEILPSWRDVEGVLKYPSLLYLDVDDRNAQFFLEDALNATLAGASIGDPIPSPPPWDRYDYTDAGASWTAALARGAGFGSTNGCTLEQLLGYRALLLNTGDEFGGRLETEDYILIDDWLTSFATYHDGDTRHGLMASGNGYASRASFDAPNALQQLGVELASGSYYGYSGDFLNECVHITNAPGAAYAPWTEYDAYSNNCPSNFDVLSATNGGVGNRLFEAVDTGEETEFSQVTLDRTDPVNDYRTVVDGISWHLLAERDPEGECAAPREAVSGAAAAELGAALDWIFDGAFDPLSSWQEAVEVPESNPLSEIVSTMLYANRPNPIGATTTLRFTLGRTGKIDMAVFDVAGRRVATLALGEFDAGSHQIEWSRTGSRGERLPGGVYWSQLRTEDYVGRKQLVVLP